jgi:transcriptional antiterminator NusG
MTETLTRNPWYALYVKPRQEKHIAVALRGRGYEEYIPLYPRHTRSRTSELPLFPGYVFCRFDFYNRLPVVSLPGVLSIVGFGGTPVPVADNEIAALQQVTQSELPRQPWPYYSAGQKVIIHTGPLQGVEGVLISANNRGRIIVSVELLRRSVAVDVDPSWISTR